MFVGLAVTSTGRGDQAPVPVGGPPRWAEMRIAACTAAKTSAVVMPNIIRPLAACNGPSNCSSRGSTTSP